MGQGRIGCRGPLDNVQDLGEGLAAGLPGWAKLVLIVLS